VGAVVRHTDSHLEVTGPDEYAGFDAELNAVGELAPSVAALAALAAPGSVSRLRGIAHLRGHETDRLAAIATELRGLGGDVTEEPDALVIRPKPLRAGTFHTYDDHRLATSAAVLGLVVPGVLVENIATTAKTMPGFVDLWGALLT